MSRVGTMLTVAREQLLRHLHRTASPGTAANLPAIVAWVADAGAIVLSALGDEELDRMLAAGVMTPQVLGVAAAFDANAAASRMRSLAVGEEHLWREFTQARATQG